MGISRISRIAWAGFGLTLCIVVGASFFPDARLWSVNQLAYLPGWTVAAIPGAALLLGVGLVALCHHFKWELSERTYVITTLAVSLVSVVVFVLAKANAYFLGDGYSLLGLLTSENPLIKPRNFGGTAVPYGVFKLMGGTIETDVLYAYQLVSYIAGGLFLLLAAWAARKLHEKPIDSLLFFLALCTGGHMLLFFGYVENYSLFIVAVAAYCLTGLLVIDGVMSRWWLLVVQALAVFFHVFGIVFLPATVLVLFREQPLVRRWWKMSGRLQLLVGVVVFMVGVLAIYVIQQSINQLTFTFLPVVHEWFTIQHYTMFSGMHLADFANQLIVLWPGLLIALAVILLAGRSKGEKKSWRAGFLALAAFLGLITAFVFDPKIGMARDWDLYAFAGMPLGLLLLNRMVSDRQKRFRSAVVLFMIAGLAVLAIRTTVLATSRAAVNQVHSLMYLDPIRNHNVWPIVIRYHMFRGDSSRVYAVDAERNALLPEEQWLMNARNLMHEGSYEQALMLALKARARYRGMGAYHANYGSALLNLGRKKEAFEELKIARIINPYNVFVLANLGIIYLEGGEPDKARECWEKALELDPRSPVSTYGMLALYCHDKDFAAMPELLENAYTIHPMRLDVFAMVAAAAISGQRYELAGRALVMGQNRGIADATVQELIAQYPQVGPYYERARESIVPDTIPPAGE